MAKKPESDAKPEIIDPAAAENADGDAVPPKETARDQVLENIQTTREAQLRENGVELAGEDDDDPADPDAEADPADPADPDNPVDPDAAGAAEEDAAAAAGEEDPDADPDAAPEAPDVRMVTIMVDGQERQVPESELIASFQKNAAADDRLRLANDILDEATARRDAPAAPAQPAEGEDEQNANPLDAVDWQAAADKLQFGSKEEGAQALRALVEEVSATNRNTGVPFDMEATQREITQRVNDGQEWQRALADFGDNYQDIIEDPQLQAMTARRANQMFTAAVEESVAAGRPQRPAYADVFRAAGEETRAWLKTVRGEGGDNPDDNPQPNPSADGEVKLSKERTDLKRTTSNIPKPRSVQKTKPTGDAKPKTANQIRREGIDEIMAKREKVA